jgi:hypothetical protein
MNSILDCFLTAAASCARFCAWVSLPVARRGATLTRASARATIRAPLARVSAGTAVRLVARRARALRTRAELAGRKTATAGRVQSVERVAKALASNWDPAPGSRSRRDSVPARRTPTVPVRRPCAEANHTAARACVALACRPRCPAAMIPVAVMASAHDSTSRVHVRLERAPVAQRAPRRAARLMSYAQVMATALQNRALWIGRVRRTLAVLRPGQREQIGTAACLSRAPRATLARAVPRAVRMQALRKMRTAAP